MTVPSPGQLAGALSFTRCGSTGRNASIGRAGILYDPIVLRTRAVAAGLLTVALLAIAAPVVQALSSQGLPRSRAERSGYVETSRAADISAFLAELSRRTNLLRISSFGFSEEGRPLVLVTASDPPVASPAEAHALGRPIVLVQANIHGGEVEGKEATQHLLRRLTIGHLRPLLRDVVVLAVPNYNADGNEQIDVMNRTEQFGPIGGVGRRENAKGLDLNRDYMKLDSAEARAFVGLLNEWDPHVVVDLHTTNGTYHGYHLTYSIPVNETLEPALLDYERHVMMPSIAHAMAEDHGWRTYYYGNVEGKPPIDGKPDTRKWVAFDHRPRIGQNYVGLRGRIAILSEAYSYLDFRARIAVTESFVTEILRFVAHRGEEIRRLTATLDEEFVWRASHSAAMPLGVDFQAKALPKNIPILLGRVRHVLNPRSGREMLAVVDDAITPTLMPDYGSFEPTRSVSMAKAYFLPDSAEGRSIVQHLLRHGIVVEQLRAPWSGSVTSFRVGGVDRAKRPFQQRHEIVVEGHDVSEPRELAAGTFVVRLAQPLGRLAAYLLEPESDDGIVHWNMLEREPRAGDSLPVLRALESAAWPSELLGARLGG